MILLALAELLYNLVMHVCSFTLRAAAFVRVFSLPLHWTQVPSPELQRLAYLTLWANGSLLSSISR